MFLMEWGRIPGKNLHPAAGFPRRRVPIYFGPPLANKAVKKLVTSAWLLRPSDLFRGVSPISIAKRAATRFMTHSRNAHLCLAPAPPVMRLEHLGCSPRNGFREKALGRVGRVEWKVKLGGAPRMARV
ncbi:hypothetical protein HNY73_021189 [Argiope bruennichi]|uniref:Uncharacterized protein n=1 Tax=Argiope bruennichi TaxID=94029 RepID=A0A8T0E942_ARGBR|nr:hypothetical protein HNY73_021189 [Argiope bruennichi]